MAIAVLTATSRCVRSMENDFVVLAIKLAVRDSELVLLASVLAGLTDEVTTLACERTYKQVANDVGQ